MKPTGMIASEWLGSFKEGAPVMVCVHGFTGTKKTFAAIADLLPDYNWLALDCLGHGESAIAVAARRYRYEAVIDILAATVKSLGVDTYHLLGYSMGARLALGWAIKYPERIQSLLLESGSPGLASEKERRERQQSDMRLAQKVEQEGIREFVTYWEQLPLFATQTRLPQALKDQVRNERLSQNPQGLATSLREMGTGSQPSYWQALATLVLPVLLIVGKQDPKFVVIAQKMKAALPQGVLQVIAAGHCVHLEQPYAFAQVVRHWLDEQGETR